MKTYLLGIAVLLGGYRSANPVPVSFTCETCTGRGKLFISGPGFSTTHEFDTKKDKKPPFPVEIALEPGEYRLQYTQNRVLQIQSTFTVRADEKNTVRVK